MRLMKLLLTSGKNATRRTWVSANHVIAYMHIFSGKQYVYDFLTEIRFHNHFTVCFASVER